MTTYSKKQIAVDFLHLTASGRSEDAFAKYVAPGFKHHNPYYAGDANTLMAAMKQHAEVFPDKVLEVQRTIAEESLVVAHSKVYMKPGEQAIALVHIFRFENDKVVELWDIGQAAPVDSPNTFGMF